MAVFLHHRNPVVCVLCTLLFVSMCADASDWPTFGGLARDWISPETGWLAQWPAEGPRILWKAEVGIGFSSFTVVDGKVFTAGWAGEQDTVYCFDAETGKSIWTYSYKAPLMDFAYEGGPHVTPTVDEGKVYMLSKVGDFFCLDAATGQLIWSKDAKAALGYVPPPDYFWWGFASSPLIEGQRVIVDMGIIAAFDKTSGNILWKTEEYRPGYASPMAADIEGTRCLVCFNGFGLVIVDMKTGKEYSKFPWETKSWVNAANPVVMGNKIFLSSGYTTGCALFEISLGKEPVVLWRNKNMCNQFSTSVLNGEFIYGFSEDILVCLEVNTGRVMWEQEDLKKGSLMLSDGKLVIISGEGKLVIAEASPEAFKEISHAQVVGTKCWTVPVLANGRIYCRNEKGTVVCVDVKG